MFYYRGTRLFALRQGDFKAHWITQSGYGPDKPEPHNPPLLFNLAVDPSERFDVAGLHPEVLKEMEREVERHKAGLEPCLLQLEEVWGKPRTNTVAPVKAQ